MNPINRAVGLKSISHYHQSHGTHPGGPVIPAHMECVEVLTGGRGWVLHKDEWVEVTPGDFLWNRPGDCTIGRSDFENPYRCLSVRFETAEADGRAMPRLTFWADVDAVLLFTREVSQLFLDDSFDRAALLDYVDSRLIYQVRLNEHTRQGERYPSPILIVMNRIERDFAEPLRIPQLAREAGWSAAYLQEAFRRHTGVTPHQWVLRRRMRAVKERLISSLDPIKQIAVECGFSDTAALTHAFKAETGSTPTAFRDHYQQFR